MHARALAVEAGVVVLFASLSLFATRPLAADLRGQTLQGADPAIYIWTVNWLSGHLLHPAQLFEGNVYHPVRHAAILSDLALGTAVLAAPLRPILRDAVALYNAGVVLTLTFGAWAFYRLGRALSGQAGGGLLAGILAAFGSHQLLHVYQLALVNIGGLALFLWALHRTAARPSASSAMLLGLAFALNTLSSGYFAAAGALLPLLSAPAHQPAVPHHKRPRTC